MGPEWVAIIALVALFVVGTVLPINMGALAYVAAWLVGHVLPGPGREGDPRRRQRRPDPDPDRGHLPVRHRQEQRHGRPDRAHGGQRGRRPGRADPVGDVRGHRGADRDRRRQPGRLRDHRPDRARLRRPLRHQPADDGHVRRPRRPGRRLLADQHLRHDHQLRHGGRRPAVQRDHGLPRQPGRQHDHGGDPVRGARRPQADEPADRPRRARTRLDEDLHRGGADASRPRGTGHLGPRPAPRRSAYRRDQVLTLLAFVAVARRSRWSSTRTSASSPSPPPCSWRCSRPRSTRTPSSRSPGRPCCWSPGVSTYATILTTAGSPEFVGNWAAGLGAAAIGALVLCYVGGVVSAFASSTALLPVIIPIAVPLIADGGISAALFVAALAVSLDDRRRQPVLHQRRPDAGQPARHDRASPSTTSRSSPTA